MLVSISNVIKRAAEEEIQIRGFGKLTRPLLQKKMKSYMDDFVKAAKTPDNLDSLKKIKYILTNKVLEVLIEAEIDQLEKEEK